MIFNREFSAHLDKDSHCTFRRKLQYFTLFKCKNNNCLFGGITFIGIKKHKFFTLLKAITFQQRKKQLLMYPYAGTTEYHKKIRDKIMSLKNEIWREKKPINNKLLLEECCIFYI